MLKWNHASFEAQTEGFVFGNSNLEHLCLEHGNLHFIPQAEPPRAESVCSRSSSADGSSPTAPSEPPTPHLYHARVEDILRGFAKDPKALAHKLRDFTVRTLLAMNDHEFQVMFEMLRSDLELTVADFFAIKVGVREAKKLLLTIEF